MKTKIILIMVFGLVGMSGCKASNKLVKSNDSIPSSLKIYSNTALGLTFQYPSTWSKYGEDANVSDRNGNLMVIGINFIDTISHTTLLIEYHLAPKGTDFYQYAVSQFDSAQGWYAKDSKKIDVAGNKAIEAFTTITIDGRGKALNPSLRLILVDFLDKQQTGAFEIQFKTPLPESDIEVTKFNQLLSTIKFAN